MSNSRLDALKAMAEKKPDDAMIQYGLGSEYKKAGDKAGAAEAFRAVIRANPEYTAAYQELGSLLVELGQSDEAKQVLEQGTAVADRMGAWKPREHMKRLLEELRNASGEACAPQADGYCE
jgi:tetratricopeptide (TPR) repeat protein